MRLAYVLGTFPSLTETFILRELSELRRNGADLIIFSLRRPADSAVSAEAAALLPFTCYRPPACSPEAVSSVMRWVAGRPVRFLRALGRALHAGWRSPIETLRRLRNLPAAAAFARRAERFGAEHIHAHFAFMPADVAAAMADLTGLAFSVSVHAADIYAQPAGDLARRLRSARFVVACTRHGAGELTRRLGLLPLGGVHSVHHGLRPDAFAAAAPQEPLVLAVGRLQPKKGFAVLVEACRLLRERGTPFQCVIAGEGPERHALESAVARHRLQDAVRLVGGQTPEQVAMLMRRARVFAAPSVMAPNGDSDSLPNVILEAMATGVPVVASRLAGIPEAIEDGATGLLAPPGDAAALASRIAELLKDGTLCRTMADRARATVAARFDIELNIRPLLDLFAGSGRSR